MGRDAPLKRIPRAMGAHHVAPCEISPQSLHPRRRDTGCAVAADDRAYLHPGSWDSIAPCRNGDPLAEEALSLQLTEGLIQVLE